MEYSKIVNPKTKRRVSINSKLGRQIVKKYMNMMKINRVKNKQNGGAIYDRCNLCGVSIYDVDLFPWRNPKHQGTGELYYLCKLCLAESQEDPTFYESKITRFLTKAARCLKESGCNVMGGGDNILHQ